MRDREAPLRAVIGFIIGTLMGVGLTFLSSWLANLMLKFKGLPPDPLQWWDFLPMSILLGLGMAALMHHPPFGMND